ncbi:ribonuclease G [Alphaproteobacteria bacterium GH1-50]|uniref:Ribonuclease G n=1 Tax=Kangsaoukella pontilimi TaxID=2691042 RepID=A0A7C9IG36_9RHOB|nr:ribonuclease E/G [Kangsaoukella pontilimi]MXQ08024.1 ribonuclease G [Kangsaoukella pontilimi]
MKGSLVAFDTVNGREAAALMVDGVLTDLLIDPPEDRIRPGAIYHARAGRQMKGQGGVVLETPDGPLFLRQAKGIAPGQSILVQASTFAERDKAAPATSRVVFKSRFALITPGAPGLNVSRSIRDEERRVALTDLAADLHDTSLGGLILRSLAEDAEDEAVADDIVALTRVAAAVLGDPLTGAPARLLDGPGAHETALRDWAAPDMSDTEEGSFARHGIDDAIDRVRRAEQSLGAGASVVIEPTRALVAVDVNTGADTSPAAGLKANIAAARALPRLLALKGLGGQIVVDMAPMPKRDRVRVEQQIKSAFRSDAVETSFVGWTPLGHAELQRKRARLSLEELLT